MKHIKLLFTAGLLACMALALTAGPAVAEVNTMTKEELHKIIHQTDVVVIDVRSGRDWSASEFKIQGAVREDPGDVAGWKDKYDKNHTIVLYCA